MRGTRSAPFVLAVIASTGNWTRSFCARSHAREPSLPSEFQNHEWRNFFENAPGWGLRPWPNAPSSGKWQPQRRTSWPNNGDLACQLPVVAPLKAAQAITLLRGCRLRGRLAGRRGIWPPRHDDFRPPTRPRRRFTTIWGSSAGHQAIKSARVPRRQRDPKGAPLPRLPPLTLCAINISLVGRCGCPGEFLRVGEYTGCRVSDLVNLELTDLMIGDRSGSVDFRHGKGRKQRSVRRSG
jgi:hypothetical protein